MPFWGGEGRTAPLPSCRPHAHFLPLLGGLVLALGLHAALFVFTSWRQLSAPLRPQSEHLTHITLGRVAPAGDAPPHTPPTPAETSPPPPVVAPHQAPNPDQAAADPTTAPTYVDASLLTTRPRIAGDLLLIYPPSAPSGIYKAQVTIHIDEQGWVEQVLVPDGALPTELAEAAISAFKAARFTPGEIDGTPVKSSVQIEVEFDSTEMQLQSDQ